MFDQSFKTEMLRRYDLVTQILIHVNKWSSIYILLLIDHSLILDQIRVIWSKQHRMLIIFRLVIHFLQCIAKKTRRHGTEPPDQFIT